MEGVAFAFADCLAALKAAGTSVERATAVGGGSRSRAWLQDHRQCAERADRHSGGGRFRRRLRRGAARPDRRRETPIRSRSAAPPKIQRDRSTPDAAAVEAYAAAFQRYRALYPAIKESLDIMSTGFFGDQQPIRYEGPESRNPLAFRCYDPDRKVLGKRMEDHFRFAVCYWHSFAWPGTDPVRRADLPAALVRRRHGEGAAQGRRRLRDVRAARRPVLHLPRPRHRAGGRDAGRVATATSARSPTSSRSKMESAKVRLLWGTANLFSNRRFMAGAATNPDPDVFAYAAAQVKNVLDVTHELGGANYVLWGGREGYETLLNTDMKRELAQLGRFLTMVVEHKEKIGFKGTILIEPKPKEPTKHQYDFDVGTHLRHAARPTTSRRRSRSTSSRTTPSSPAIPSSTRSSSPPRSASSARST